MRDGSKTRARIVSEALALFARKGVDGTSVREIAAAVGVAEGALYRHFPSKDELARDIFLTSYRDLAGRIGRAAEAAVSFEAAVSDIIGIFTALFDDNRPLFTFLLLSQHAFLADVPERADANVVEAIASLFRRAIERGEIAPGDPDLLAAIALGIVAQPATFTIYGRLDGPLSARRERLSRAVLDAAGAAAPPARRLRSAAGAQ
jgi:AcrR family transcriptional regulator